MISFLNALQASALFLVVTLAPFGLLVAILIFRKRFLVNRNRRSPLTSELLRPPGFGLLERIEDLNWDIGGDAMAVVMVSPFFAGVYLAQVQANPDLNPWIVIPLSAIFGGALVAFFGVRIVKRVVERQKYREALAGELATAQLLEPVLAKGGRLFHDVQAPGFNIDHVVVCSGGVYAVETKHRLKPTTGHRNCQSRVSFDGKALHFPGWTETKPIEQARAQARWLSGRLSRSTGLTVKSRPVLALPGWYVELKVRSDVMVTNPKNWHFMLKPIPNERALPEKTIQRIAFQIEQLCQMPTPGESDRSRS